MSLCPGCQAPAAQWDRYCGRCGTPLARLRWQLADQQRELGEDGRVAVRRGSHALRLSVANEGSVPAGLVLPAEALAELPPWIDRARLERLQERAITLEPGQEQELAIPFATAELERVFDDRGQQGAPLSARLQLLTTLCQLSEGGWSPRPLHLSLVVAREPWFSPAGSHYRFLPSERLAEGLHHELTLHNESAEEVEILGFSLEDLPDAPPSWAQDAARLDAAQILEGLPSAEHTLLAPGEQRGIRLSFANPALEGLGWFSLRLSCRYRHRSAGQVFAVVQGVVGAAPRLTCDAPEPLGHPSVERDEVHTLVLRNPGDLPLKITGVELLRGDAVAPARDWLRVEGLAPGEILPPGGERALHYTLSVADRPEDEFDQAWSSRRLRIHHDGAGARVLERSVDAQLGVVQVPTGVFMGVDFGTSNSMVVLLRPDTRANVALKLEGESEQLPSLMYFLGSSPSGRSQGFLFGREADAHAELNPANLVRSIKSVISRSPDTWYHFLERSPEGAWRRRSYRPQELLDRFIIELRRRAERAVSGLSMQQLRALRIGPKVRFRQAIFSHPVEVDAAMKEALMKAAHAAGLNLQLQSAEDFIEERCVDEATSAALAYVYARLDPGSRVGVEHELGNRERVICVDIGGGTTDVAAVEILDLADFWDQAVEQVRVELHSTAGDPLWGGDDLDLLLAGWMLEEIREQSARQGAAILDQEILHAAGFRSFGEYFNGFRARQVVRGSEALGQAQAFYNKAVEVLRKAEAAKRRLSELDRVEVRLSDRDWPRSGEQPEQEAEFRVVLERQRLERQVREDARARIPLLERVVGAAEWEWPTVSTVLFTGQGSRVPSIREELVQHVQQQRAGSPDKLLVVQPDDRSGFDPKRCVGMGAAIWGTREDGEWISVRRRMRFELTHDLQTRWGPFHFRTVPGLERGQSLPAQATVDFRKPRQTLELFRDGALYMSFTFPEAVDAIELQVRGPGDILAVAGALQVPGEVVS